MAERTFHTIVQRQIRILDQMTETLMARALAGKGEDLERLFLTQDHLEHWLQYLSPLAMDRTDAGLDVPPPLPSMRPAPPVAHEVPAYVQAMAQYEASLEDEQVRPRVTFPPDPPWVEDLERSQETEP